MDEDDYEFDAQPKYEAAFRDFERVGPAQKGQADVILDAVHAGEKLSIIYRKAAQQGFTQENTIKELVGLFYNTFGAEKGFLFPYSTIAEGVSKMKWLQFKNPIALVIGIKILNEKKEIQQSRLDAVWLSFRGLLQNENIQKQDVIRYARMWIELLK